MTIEAEYNEDDFIAAQREHWRAYWVRRVLIWSVLGGIVAAVVLRQPHRWSEPGIWVLPGVFVALLTAAPFLSGMSWRAAWKRSPMAGATQRYEITDKAIRVVVGGIESTINWPSFTHYRVGKRTIRAYFARDQFLFFPVRVLRPTPVMEELLHNLANHIGRTRPDRRPGFPVRSPLNPADR